MFCPRNTASDRCILKTRIVMTMITTDAQGHTELVPISTHSPCMLSLLSGFLTGKDHSIRLRMEVVTE